MRGFRRIRAVVATSIMVAVVVGILQLSVVPVFAYDCQECIYACIENNECETCWCAGTCVWECEFQQCTGSYDPPCA